MLPLVLTLSTALAADAPPPAALLLQVIDELPDDAQLQTLHWDGRRVWINGTALTRLTDDGVKPGIDWPSPASRSLGLDILASPTFSTAQMPRQDAFVMALSAPPLAVDASAPLVLQAEDIWLDEPDYAAGLVHVRGLADSSKALRRLERLAALSPCLADSRVSPHELERLPIAFTLTARSLGDLRSQECAPRTTGVAAPPADASLSGLTTIDAQTIQLQGAWDSVWQLLSQSGGAPIDTFSIRTEGDELVVQLKYFTSPASTSGKDTKAIEKHVGTPNERLLSAASALPTMYPDTLGYDMLGATAPRSGVIAEVQAALVDEHKQHLHKALSVLDSTMVDLQALKLRELRQNHRQVVELVFDLRLVGDQSQIDANLRELEIPSVRMVPLRSDEVRLPPIDNADANSHDVELVVSVPVMPGAPRSPSWSARELPAEAPRNPFSQGPAWATKKAELDAAMGKLDPLLRPKARHIAYLGHIGTAMPRGLVALPDGSVHVVRQGDKLGDAWAPITHFGDAGLQLRLQYTLLDGNDVSRDVELPAAPHPPEEAPTPSKALATLQPEPLAELRARFPDGDPIDIDMADASLEAVIAHITSTGVDVRLADGLAQLPRVSVQATEVPVGDLLTQLQVVLFDHGLVFDGELVLRSDPEAAKRARAALFTGGELPITELPQGPLSQAPKQAVRMHVGPATPVQLMQLMRVGHLSTSSGASVHLSEDDMSASQMLAAIDASLESTGHQLVVSPMLSGVLVVAR